MKPNVFLYFFVIEMYYIYSFKIFLSIHPRPALLTPPLLMPFTTEKITDCTNEAVKGANKAPRNPPSSFLFHVLLFQ